MIYLFWGIIPSRTLQFCPWVTLIPAPALGDNSQWIGPINIPHLCGHSEGFINKLINGQKPMKYVETFPGASGREKLPSNNATTGRDTHLGPWCLQMWSWECCSLSATLQTEDEADTQSKNSREWGPGDIIWTLNKGMTICGLTKGLFIVPF